MRATYTELVVDHDAHVYEFSPDATWDGDVVVVVDAPFFGWAYSTHDVYIGIYVHEGWIVVPGVVVEIKHGKMKKHKGKHHKGKH